MGQDNQITGQGTSAAAAAPALDRKALETQILNAGTPGQCRAELYKIFDVQPDEVALLRLEKGLLRFLFPSELNAAGSIPISSSSAIAAHTAVTKKVDLFNNFTIVKHASIFESVKPGAASSEEMRPATIQKLMSAPVLDKADRVLGVVQICHKGFDLASAGPDFTLDDLQKLELVAKALAHVGFLREQR